LELKPDLRGKKCGNGVPTRFRPTTPLTKLRCPVNTLCDAGQKQIIHNSHKFRTLTLKFET